MGHAESSETDDGDARNHSFIAFGCQLSLSPMIYPLPSREKSSDLSFLTAQCQHLGRILISNSVMLVLAALDEHQQGKTANHKRPRGRFWHHFDFDIVHSGVLIEDQV